MAQNNVSVFSDVSTCLSDALDMISFNDHNIIMPENNNTNFDKPNNGEPSSAEALKLMMNKRKIASNATINEENGNGNAKRLCSMNGQLQHEQKA